MTKDDVKWLVGVSVSCLVLFIGGATTYSKIISKGDVSEYTVKELELKITHLEQCTQQQQKELNIFRVQVSNVAAKIQNIMSVVEDLSEVLKDVSKSNNNIALAVSRLEERQKTTDRVLEKLVEKID